MKSSRVISKCVAELLSAALSRISGSVRKPNLRKILAAGVVIAGLFCGSSLYATITGSVAPGGTAVISGTENTSIGTGPTHDNNTVTISSTAILDTGNDSAISLGDNAKITIEALAVVMNTTVSGNGYYGAGPGKNTIEFKNNGYLYIADGAVVRANSKNASCEPINVIGYGNTIVNYGTIDSVDGTAIWFQETYTSSGSKTLIDNYGSILTNSNTSTAIGFTNVTQNSNVHFINHTNAYVKGNLNFASGDDTLTLYPNSTITGGFNGGTGYNTIELTGAAGTAGTFDGELVGSVANFDKMVKDGESHWVLTGAVGSSGRNLAVEVKEGTLALTGNNTAFQGTVDVLADGILEGNTQSLPGGVPITNNGGVRFVNRNSNAADNGTYSGKITGTGWVEKTGSGTVVISGTTSDYTGGTIIKEGAFSISSDANLGASSGGLTLDGGTLINTAAIATNRQIEITANDGTFQTNANLTINSAITGDGKLTKTGNSDLILTAANTYDGGTAAQGTGAVVLNGAGTINGNVQLLDAGSELRFAKSSDYEFSGVVSGSGKLNQSGPGKVTLTGNNTYQNGTAIADGTELAVGNGGNTGTLGNGGQVVINGNGHLSFNRGNEYVFNGNLNTGATGKVTQDGNGKTIFTGNNTGLTGIVEVNTGILQVGQGNNNSSINNAASITVKANSELAFDMPDEVFNNIITGEGSFHQVGGKTTFSTDQTYIGGTTIDTNSQLQLGSGGTTGSVIGDITDNGELIFNRSDDYTVGALISGSGALTQNGTGSIILTADNSYKGATTVENGELYIDGDQSAADGAAAVKSGATIGGTGTIGGDVTIENGGTLSPGAAGSVGVLTINKDLILENGAVLEYDFGEANVVGGALNDLTVVKGDLVLAGTININLTPTGKFDPGVFRVISYDGNLQNNTLNIGTVPAPANSSDWLVQTVIDKQVNLINRAGLQLIWWDTKDFSNNDLNNNVISGGTGIWNNNTTQHNWTDENGLVNEKWDDSEFAIFAGEAGTVTVSNISGQVKAEGMQFMVDGYLITGEKLELVNELNGIAIIRVGDGTANGASFTATISAELTGNAILEKSDLGTLVLTGDNTYTGGTLVGAGTLSISKDTNLGQAGTNLTLDGGTLNTTADITSSRPFEIDSNGGTFDTGNGTKLTLQSGVTGTGDLTKTGDGNLELTVANSYAGGTKISDGSIILSNAGTIPGDVELDAITKAGSLVFNRTDSYNYNGVISGEGTVKQQGTGTTILTGGNTYKGTTEIEAGKVQVGNAGTAGTLGGSDVQFTGNGELSFDRSDTYEFGGSISGTTGKVSQDGNGRTVLEGNNTGFSGDVAVNTGTLQIGKGTGTDNASIGNAKSITIAQDATLAFNLTDEKFDNVISGDGNFTQMEGKTTFTADQNYTGKTAIESNSVLQIGDGKNGSGSGSIASIDITNDGQLIFDKDTEYEFAAEVKGSGSLEQMGSGKLVLTGGNTYTGGTIIDSGSQLQLGNGGTTGSVAGSITDNGELFFNHSDSFTVNNLISGTGAVSQIGSGETVLTGSNSYAGTTNVENGKLYISGDQTAATGLTTVKSGATIGGIGTIGGSVIINGGGILNPGEITDVPGTLTINKDLTLEDGAVLEYNFGQANVEGGLYNDLTIVKGDLNLDGRIDVKKSAGGSFSIGVYRVIKYDGTLTDNTLDKGTMPTSDPENWKVQTSVDKQVNLIYTAGEALNYWDGEDSSLFNNNQVNGGDGVWTAENTDSKWTNDMGVANADWSAGWFGIFEATPGTVQVSNAKGPVIASGMQFAADGYEITGEDLTLVSVTGTDSAQIRVGDGTAQGADYTAEISADLTGNTALKKTDLGTLGLTGENSYTDGTIVEAGTLKGNIPTHSDLTVESGATYDGTGAARDVNALNGDGIVKNTNDLTVSGGNWGGNIDDTNSGKLIKAGGGIFTVTDENTFNNTAEIQEGTLKLAGDGSIEDSALFMLNGSTLDIADGTSPKTFASLEVEKNTTIALGDNRLNLDSKNIQFDIFGNTPNGSIITNTTGTGSVSMENSNVILNTDTSSWHVGDKVILIKNNVIEPNSFTYDAPDRFTGTAHFYFKVWNEEDDLVAEWYRQIDDRTKVLLNNGLASMAMLNQSQNWMYDVGFGLLDKQSYISPCEAAGKLDCGYYSDDCRNGKKSLLNKWIGFGGFEGGASRYKPSGSIFDLDSYHIHAGFGKVTRNAYGNLTYGGLFEAGFGNLRTFAVKGKGDSDYQNAKLFVRHTFENRFYLDGTFSAGYTETELDTGFYPNQPVHLDSDTPFVGASAGIGRVHWLASNRNIDTYVRYFYNRRSSDSLTLAQGDPLTFSAIESNRLQVGGRVNFLSTEIKNIRLFAGAAYEHEFSGTARGTVWGEELESTSLNGSTWTGELGLQIIKGHWSGDVSVRGYDGRREGVSGYIGAGYRF